MRFGPISNVRVRLTLTILAVIVLSWLLSAGTVIYFARQEAVAIRQHWHHAPPAVRESLRTMWTLAREGNMPVLWLPLPIGKGAFLARLCIALLLALCAGAWLSRRITRPLTALSDGACAFHRGEFAHRIPLAGDDEFTRVAAAMNEMAARVAAQLAAQEDDARRRRQLLADVAHDLRSPVATLKTMAEALRDGVAAQPERRTLALSTMVETADRLRRLVDDLLDLTRLDLRELSLHREPVDLRALAIEALEAHAPAADAAGIVLSSPAAGDPVLVDGDPHRLAQVLDNLLDNAISYAGHGATVQLAVADNDPRTLVVCDSGAGITAEHLPYLFDPFYRADAARTPGDRHSGLGLRIARGLVEAHGGTLTLDSQSGAGTRVTITLPAVVE